ncbi:MAG: metallophosphoesterase [Lachnospiraceae bacterium]|nr:metallophosphoesterase [Lachnospiraceae bacterium]
MSKTLPIITASLGIAAVASGAVVWHDMHRFVIRRYEVRSGKIGKDRRIVLLADLHDQTYGRHNERLLEAISEIAPDMVLSAGDLITAHHNPEKQRGEESTALLMTLARRYTLIAANGNHETKIDRRRELYEDRYDDYEAFVHSAGGMILRNESVKIPGERIQVAGLELPLSYYKHFVKKPLSVAQLNEWLGRPDPENYNIMIAHHPDYFEVYRAWGADLVLSGHIHGGIVRLPWIGGVVSPTARLFPYYDGGRYDEEGSTLILSRGLGTHSIPIRFLNPGELVVIDVKAR